MNESRHPLREPMVWLLIGLPVAAVVAGILTVVISSRSGGNDAVIDPVARTAQIQTVELGPDERASELKLSAVLQVDGRRLLLLPASGAWTQDTTAPSAPSGDAGDVTGRTDDAAQQRRDGTSHDRPLSLALSHPTDASRDLRVELQPTELGWWTELERPLDSRHDWLLQLGPKGGRWRLQGRLIAGQQAARLGPALGEE
ncbi:FixH family protein [Marilutibacter chinensis]|uniref:FixH family protein n=1 Tax=Marilutibacter chinensis TaxID=2912247 RepID=A0ABS9HT88_9GAMM|nr:FixH family protein [Lysobacter chinensis]MCF7221419.1 FixH family protein [Lysobacter chinensis]